MCFSVLHRLRIIDFKSRSVSARGVMYFCRSRPTAVSFSIKTVPTTTLRLYVAYTLGTCALAGRVAAGGRFPGVKTG